MGFFLFLKSWAMKFDDNTNMFLHFGKVDCRVVALRNDACVLTHLQFFLNIVYVSFKLFIGFY